ncbi:sodium:calcium antiporter (plasmid) [Chloroflexota bacterium]|nr:sodium:calcium antiporter [Chloroflexota bacterium]
MLDYLDQSFPLLIVFGVASIAVLVLSSNVAVKKLTGLAGYFRLSTTFMGVTVVSLATSIPEIAAHYTASFGILSGALDFQVSSAVVLGANIGSDVIQQTLIMAVVILMAGGLQFKRYFLWKSMIPMIATTVLCIILGVDGVYSRLDGVILFGSFLAYMYYLYVDERKHYREEDHGFTEEGEKPEGVPENGKQALRDAGIALAALALTVGSAMIALKATEVVVAKTGVGGSLIGVITLGVASALPELITAISGVRHGDAGISLGTLVGSNITNPLVAIGGGALISRYWVPGPLVLWDLPWETITGAVLWLILWFNKGKLGKWSAFYLIALYFVYIALRMIFFAAD